MLEQSADENKTRKGKVVNHISICKQKHMNIVHVQGAKIAFIRSPKQFIQALIECFFPLLLFRSPLTKRILKSKIIIAF